MIQRIHLSTTSKLNFEDRLQKNEEFTGKPKGLWYSINNSWEEWIQENISGWVEDHPYKYLVKINLEKMLILSHQDMLPFTEQYGCSMADYFMLGVNKEDAFSRFAPGYIDWTKVRKDYVGIEIPEYHWDFRLASETFWYYGWDCASGCIWSKEGLLSIRKYPAYTKKSWTYARRQAYGPNGDRQYKQIRVTAKRKYLMKGR